MKYTYTYYQNLLDFYLRILIKSMLEEMQKFYLAENQSIYITFNIHCQGVRISNMLRNKYERTGEIVIVLQKNDYENLVVSNIGFEVVLAFGNVNEVVFIPFSSIMNFIDTIYNFSITIDPVNYMQIINSDYEVSDHPNPKTEKSNLLQFLTIPPKCINFDYQQKLEILYRVMVRKILEEMEIDDIRNLQLSFDPNFDGIMSLDKISMVTLSEIVDLKVDDYGINIQWNHEAMFIPLGALTSFRDLEAKFCLNMQPQNNIKQIKIINNENLRKKNVNNLLEFELAN